MLLKLNYQEKYLAKNKKTEFLLGVLSIMKIDQEVNGGSWITLTNGDGIFVVESPEVIYNMIHNES